MPRRAAPAIPTASMSDVAFLLLLFFLVSTTIGAESGIPMTLPPKPPYEGLEPASEHIVTVAADGALRLDGAAVSAEGLRARLARTAAARPLVTLYSVREAPYAAYVAALDGILLAHRDADAAPRLRLHPS